MKAITIQKIKGSNQESLARYCTFFTRENCKRDIYLDKEIDKKYLLTNGMAGRIPKANLICSRPLVCRKP